MAEDTTNGCVDEKRIGRAARKCAAGSSPVQRLCSLVLCEAAKSNADRIRISLSAEEKIVIEYEIASEWKPVESPPRKLLEAIVTQLLMLNEYGPGGIPIVADDSNAVASVALNEMSMTIDLPGKQG